jgi:hypothetical protein
LRAAALLLFFAAGCGDPLVRGSYLGDATIELVARTSGDLPKAGAPTAAALWLGYAGLAQQAGYGDVATLSIGPLTFPGTFTLDVLDGPPDTGVYASAGGGRIDGYLRLARLLLFDDRDHDGRARVDASGTLEPPDQLLATADHHLLVFVSRSVVDPSGLDGDPNGLLTNWELGGRGYHLAEVAATSPPKGPGRIVPAHSTIDFSPAPVAASAP